MPHDWAMVTDLFHRALDQPSARRSAWLDETCGSNAQLRTEVESLLAAHDDAGTTFLDTPVPAAIGPYRIRRALGAGGMGIVYLAEDTRLGRVVALKALAPDATGDPIGRERLRREARAAAALSHPGIATVYALEDLDGALYVASEFVAGETLRDEMARGPVPAEVIVATGIALADALAAAHARGLVHRDIKPENVMRTADGAVKILDFGLAHDLGETVAPGGARLTRDGTTLGTPAYMSPEQIRHQPIDGRADLFALGALLYEMATRANPFAADTAAATIANVLEREPPPIPGPVGDVLRRALAKDPAARFATADALRDALVAVRSERRSGAAPAATASIPARPVVSWWQFHQVATTVAYVALVIGLWAIRDWMPPPAGVVVVLAGLGAALGASALRLHLLFTIRWYPDEWAAQLRQSRPWIRTADIVLAAALLLAVALTMTAHDRIAAVFVAAAVAVVVSSAIIEPATTRAAFPGR
jgi:hypothetical protein